MAGALASEPDRWVDRGQHVVNGPYNPGGTPRADYPAELPHLEHRFTFWPKPALNRTNILGAGSFITIPLLISALGGLQSLCWAGCWSSPRPQSARLRWPREPWGSVFWCIGSGLGWPGMGHLKLWVRRFARFEIRTGQRKRGAAARQTPRESNESGVRVSPTSPASFAPWASPGHGVPGARRR